MNAPQEEISVLYWRCFDKGENLQGWQVAKIIGIRRLRKYGMAECARVLVDLMERCDFYSDEKTAREDLEFALL